MPQVSLWASVLAVPSACKEASPFPRAQEHLHQPSGRTPTLPSSPLSLQKLSSYLAWAIPMSFASPGARNSLRTEAGLDM